MRAPRRASAGSLAVWTRRAATPISSASLTKPCVGTNQGGRAPWAGGGPGPEALGLDAHHVVGAVVVGDGGDVEVFPRRRAQPRRGVHRRLVGVRAQHRALGGAEHGAERRDGVADRGAGRRRPVVGRGAGAGSASSEVLDSSMTITGSGISAPTVSGTDVTDSFRVDGGRSLRMADEQTARRVPYS